MEISPNHRRGRVAHPLNQRTAFISLALVLALCPGCTERGPLASFLGEAGPPAGDALPADGSLPDAAPDTAPPAPDLGPSGCTGDAHCAHLDGPQSKGACLGGTCQMQCTGDGWDVNGSTADGCEVVLAVTNTSEAAASAWAALDDCDSPRKVKVRLPSDDRYHTQSSTTLPNGFLRHYKVYIKDALCRMDGEVKVSLKALPATNTYQVETRFACDKGGGTQWHGDRLNGGKTTTVKPHPKLNCPTANDSGTLYLRLQKAGGPAHSAAEAELTITP